MRRMTNRQWSAATRRATKSLPDAYRVITTDPRGFTLERIATGSTVRVTRIMIDRTIATLATGKTIPKREISYTSAIEAAVIAAIPPTTIVITEKGYSAK